MAPSAALEPGAPLTAQDLSGFAYARTLSASPSSGIYLLGHISAAQTIIHLARTPLDADLSGDELGKWLGGDVKVDALGGNDIYKWAHVWLGAERPADLRVDVISPATDVHIKKYSTQVSRMTTETPEMYKRVVEPFIASFPASRTQWVRNILDGSSEADRVVYHDPHPENGFILIPDLKWDLKTVSTLYLTAMAHDARITSLRALRRRHLPLLRNIQREASRVCAERYGVQEGGLRMYVHYQPSYYHFHVHIVSLEHDGYASAAVGRAHLLSDLIDLLELSDPNEEDTLLQKRTLHYVLGEQHGLYAAMLEADSGK